MSTSIAHLILNVQDYEESTDFYNAFCEKLGVEKRVVHEGEDVKIMAYQIPGCPLYLRWSRDEEKKDFVRNVGLDHLAIKVESKGQVDVLHEFIQERGLEVTIAPKSFPEYTENYYAFYFRDPNGFPLEIAFI